MRFFWRTTSRDLCIQTLKKFVIVNRKTSPLEESNHGEKLDPNFFLRLKNTEDYFTRHAVEDPNFYPNYEAIKEINTILLKNELSQEDIIGAVEIFNQTTSKPHHNGTRWFDLRLHLRHIAFVYGLEFKISKDLTLKLVGENE